MEYSGFKSLLVICILLLMTFVELLEAIASSDHQLSGDIREFCERETFSPSCAADEVVLIDHALFGRMRSGRCITSNYGVMGCRLDVRDLLDSSCSGRKSCEVTVAGLVPERSQPCPTDFRGYLEVAYRCIRVIDVSNQYCKSPGHIEIRDRPSGYLSSVVTRTTGCGSFDNPWWLTVQPGRRIRLTLFDFSHFTREATRTQQQSATCHVLAVIKEDPMQTSQTVCSKPARETVVFVSMTNVVEVRLGGTSKVQNGASKDSYFFLYFEAFGCADPVPPKFGSVQRIGDNAIITCNDTTVFGHSSSTSVRVNKWHLTCENDEWKGPHENCSVTAAVSSIISWQFFEKSQGISIFLILSIAFLVGVCMVVIGSLYLRRHRIRREEALRQQADRLVSDYQYRLKGVGMDPTTSGRPVTLPSTELDSYNTAENNYYRTWGRPSRFPQGGPFYPQDPSAGDNLTPGQPFIRGTYPPTPYTDLAEFGDQQGEMGLGPQAPIAFPQHFIEHVYESPKFDRRDVV